MFLSTAYSNDADEEFGDTGIRGTIYIKTDLYPGYEEHPDCFDEASITLNEFNCLAQCGGCFATVDRKGMILHSYGT